MAVARIAVVGGFAMELAFWASRRPGPNEIVQGDAFEMRPGGKGFAQAVAASRADGKVVAIGRIGQDDFGDLFLRKLVVEGVETRWLVRDPLNGTAVVSPLSTKDGDAGVLLVPRANGALEAQDIARATQVLANSDVVLLQMETPPAASQLAAALGRSGGAKVILNAAPYAGQDLPGALLAVVDILVVRRASLPG
ncbi:MAG: PfkB family carbohydrate kinase [Anaerolineae bacterium]|nr:PfkB family carbohydrate kinase [Anaerolineae bacterium]